MDIYLNKSNIGNASEVIKQNGFVIIQNLIDNTTLDTLHRVMMPTTIKLMEQRKWGGQGALPGHLQQFPPRSCPYVFRDILCNDALIKISNEILGSGVYCNYYSTNTNCPGSIAQPVHPDWVPLWPGTQIAHPAVSLIINIPLIAVDANNGSIELWPETHKCYPASKHVSKEEQIQRINRGKKPMQPVMQKGDVLIRDARIWHRGMPNYSDNPRHMLAIVHNIYWFKCDEPQIYHINCKKILQHKHLNFHVKYTKKPIDYTIDIFEKYQSSNN